MTVSRLTLPNKNEAANLGFLREWGSVSIVGVALVLVWLLVVVDGIWTYASVHLLGGRVIPVTAVMWLILAQAVVIGVVKGRTGVIGTTIVIVALMFCGYLLIALGVHIYRGSVTLLQDLHGFFLYYFYLIIFPFLAPLRGMVSSTFLAPVLLLSALVSSAVGFIQHMSGDLFEFGRTISVESGVFNLGFFGEVRGNAFFAHAEDLGFFLAMVAGGVAARFMIEPVIWKKVICGLCLVLLALGCYATLARSAYLGFAGSIFVAIVIASGKFKRGILIVLPIILAASGVILFLGRSAVSGLLLDSSNVFSTDSLESRILGTTYYLNILDHEGYLSWLFGRGTFFYSSLDATFPIDNGYLAVVLNTGIIGLAFWLTISWLAWGWLLTQVSSSQSSTLIGLASAYSTWLMLSVFGLINLYQMIPLLALTITVPVPVAFERSTSKVFTMRT